jgi:hypothetical protein
MSRSRRPNASPPSAAAQERAVREIVRGVCAARAEIERLARHYALWEAALGRDRTQALLRDERARWQRESGCCARCGRPVDDHRDANARDEDCEVPR